MSEYVQSLIAYGFPSRSAAKHHQWLRIRHSFVSINSRILGHWYHISSRPTKMGDSVHTGGEAHIAHSVMLLTVSADQVSSGRPTPRAVLSIEISPGVVSDPTAIDQSLSASLMA